MESWSLILLVIFGNAETGPIQIHELDRGLTFEDCQELLEIHAPLFMGDDLVGLHCESETGNRATIVDLTPWEEMEP